MPPTPNHGVVLFALAFIVAHVATLDGRQEPRPKERQFVATGPSIWSRVKDDERMYAWFKRYLRCSRAVFYKIAERVEAVWDVAHGPLHHHAQHSVSDRVAVAMFYLAHVDGFDCTGQVFGICRTLAKRFTDQVVHVLVKFYLRSTIAFPKSKEGWRRNQAEFEAIAGFPSVCCAIDGTLIRIRRFADHEGWYCRKGFPAFNVLAVVDARQRFLAISIKPGSQNDQGMYNDSILGRTRVVPETGYILGDAGYTLQPHVLTPYPIETGMAEDESYYNLVHSRTRIVVEQAFGSWKSKFRIFKKGLEQRSPATMAQLIESTMILHNWIIDLENIEDDCYIREWMHVDGDTLLTNELNRVSSDVSKTARDRVKRHLFSNK